MNATENAPTVALFEPAALTFGRTDSTLQLTTTRVGSDPLSILSVSSDADWLSIDGETLDDDGFGGFSVNVDRTDLADGIYSASLGFETSAGIQAVSVKMQVLADTEPGDITNHYILLVDSNSYQVAAQAEAIEGTGEYILSEVSAGTYYLIAGTDMDNDGKVGDSGEAFGAYLSLDDPVLLVVSGNLNGLDLKTAFRLALPGTLPSGGGYPVLKAGMKDW